MKHLMRHAWLRFAMLGRIGWVVAAVYAASLAVVGAWALRSWEDSYGTRPVDEAAYLVCLVVAVCCGVRALRSARGRRRYGWLTLSLALSAWVLAEVIQMFEEVHRDSLSWHPSLTQAVLIGFPLGAYGALLLLSDLDKAPRRRLVLDGVIVAASLFVVSWVCLLNDLPGDGAHMATLLQIGSDVVLMTTAILVWSRPMVRMSVSLMAAGVTTIVVADTLSVYVIGVGGYHSGGWVDLVRVAGFGMLAFAALFSIDEHAVETSAMDLAPGVRVWLPYVPLLMAGVAGISYELLEHDHRTLFVAEAILVATVLARQMLVLVENQRLLAEVAREAFHDNLTGLANRAHFLDKLDSAVAHRRRIAEPVAVLCLDLDNFKAVNDALGHPAGDELLIRVAGRLTTALGDSWTVARLGGDEFAALSRGPVDALAAANRVLEGLDSPIVIDGVPQIVRPSIGLTIAASRPEQTADDLLLNADLAMYAAKRDGGGCVRSFVPDLPAPWELEQLTNQRLGQQDSAMPSADPLPGATSRREDDAPRQARGGPPRGDPRRSVRVGGRRRVLHAVDDPARPRRSHRGVGQRVVSGTEHLGGGAGVHPRVPGPRRAMAVPSHRRGHGELRGRRRGLCRLGSRGPDAVGGGPAVPGVLPVGLRGHGPADAGTAEAGADRTPDRCADLRSDARCGRRGGGDRSDRCGTAGRTGDGDGRPRLSRR